MFYDRFLELCIEKGVKPTNAYLEAGLSRGLAAKWKTTKTEKPSADALEKLSAYFNKSIDEILNLKKQNIPTESGARMSSDDDIKFALFGTREIDDDVLEQVKSFAKFARENRKDK